jgi:uncharacterized membrane-anchored protein YitT (DUF2179 family)
MPYNIRMTKYNLNFRKIGLMTVAFILSGVIQVVALNAFLIPSNVFSGGFNGIAQLLALFFHNVLHIEAQTGLFILLFNIPIGIIGWKMIGGPFTIISFANAIFVSVLQIFAPVADVANDTFLASLFGGLLIGAAIGIAMRYGFSTGGMDIVAMVVQKRTGRSIGAIMNIMNAAVVLAAGAVIGWQNALFTLIGMYVTGQAVDKIHTGYQKLTAMIVTNRGDAVVEALHADLIRGITVLPSRGAFTGNQSTTLMMVLSRYELFEMQQIVHAVDPKAFINLMSTVNVAGEFWDADTQKAMRRSTLPKVADILEEQGEN